MFSIYAFSEDQLPVGSYVGMTAVTDQIAHTEGDNLYVPPNSNLVGEVAFMGATAPGYPYLVSPSLREFSKLYVHPVNALVTPMSIPLGLNIPHTPIKLVQGEGLQAYDNSNPGVAELHSMIVFLADAPIQPVMKNFITVKATASVTSTAGKWGSGTISFSDTIPVGRYAIIGCKCVAADVMAFRLVLSTGSNRPGGIAHSSLEYESYPHQRAGGMGVWGEFHSLTPPSLEILGDGSAASQVLLFDLVYLGT